MCQIPTGAKLIGGVDRKIESRLKKDIVAWLCTVGADSRPHATLVWFWWDGESFTVYSVPGRKVKDIESNVSVLVLLNSDPEGAQMIRVPGTAKIISRKKPADPLPGYVRKYRTSVKNLGYTFDQFAGQYHIEIRIRPERAS